MSHVLTIKTHHQFQKPEHSDNLKWSFYTPANVLTTYQLQISDTRKTNFQTSRMETNATQPDGAHKEEAPTPRRTAFEEIRHRHQFVRLQPFPDGCPQLERLFGGVFICMNCFETPKETLNLKPLQVYGCTAARDCVMMLCKACVDSYR
jgi:hypothetical protein